MRPPHRSSKIGPPALHSATLIARHSLPGNCVSQEKQVVISDTNAQVLLGKLGSSPCGNCWIFIPHSPRLRRRWEAALRPRSGAWALRPSALCMPHVVCGRHYEHSRSAEGAGGTRRAPGAPDCGGIGRAMRDHRLPFFYGWVIVAVAFITMGLGVNV